MTRAAKKILWITLTPVFVLAGLFGLWSFNFSRTHRHCIKNSGLALRQYATAHEGRFPFHTNGFGDALLLLVKEEKGDTNGEYTVPYITGPGDNGEMFKEALKTGVNVAEEKCSRIYIQGLSETNNPQIAILFDKKSIAGGDHFRRPWGPLLREVCMVDGSMQTVREENGPHSRSLKLSY
jgi:hypothetical protein